MYVYVVLQTMRLLLRLRRLRVDHVYAQSLDGSEQQISLHLVGPHRKFSWTIQGQLPLSELDLLAMSQKYFREKKALRILREFSRLGIRRTVSEMRMLFLP